MIPYSKQSIHEEDIESVVEVLKSPWITQGPKVQEFEKKLTHTLGCKYAVACSSGTSALHLAYAALGVDKNSVGIVPAVTFAATANAFRYLMAEVIFSDVDPEHGLVDLCDLENKMRFARKIKPQGVHVVSPVSLAGRVANLKEVRDLAIRYDFLVVEDASHSPGGYLSNNESMIRSASCEFSTASTVSFHPVKHICCGEGGAALFDSEDHSLKALQLRSHGIKRDTGHFKDRPWYYEQVELGWNYRMTDMQAALGICQISRLEKSIQLRTRVAKRYSKLFSDSSLSEQILLPDVVSGHAWHLYVIRFRNASLRDKAYHFLRNNGIITQIHYIPLYRHPFHSANHKHSDFPGAEDYFSRCLSLPMFPDITDQEQNLVVKTLEEFLK